MPALTKITKTATTVTAKLTPDEVITILQEAFAPHLGCDPEQVEVQFDLPAAPYCDHLVTVTHTHTETETENV